MAQRPQAIDLFCKAGGVSEGLRRAGFDVIGVDIEPQPRYPFTFVQADALDPPFDLSQFDFIWASPPCQDYTALKNLTGKEYPRLIPAVREMLEASGVPWTIENVMGSELRNPIRLCGSMFGLGVWRHRLFEMSDPPLLVPPCSHHLCPKPVDVTGTGASRIGDRWPPTGGNSRKPRNLEHAREVMGINWMKRTELSQAIPPPYAEYIGRHVLQSIEGKRI